MKHCQHCGRDNPDDAKICEGCGNDFEKSSLPKGSFHTEPLAEGDMDNDWVTLVRCQNLIEADILASHLEVAEIPSFVPDEYSAQATPFNMTASNGVRVQVSPKDYEAAKQLLESLNDDSTPDAV